MIDLIKVWMETEKNLKKNEMCKQYIKDSIKGNRIYYEKDDLGTILREEKRETFPKNVTVTDSDSFTAASIISKKHEGKIAVLNFANAYHPGGGVKRGAVAQEEDLCRCSTLYAVLDTKENWRDFYDRHNQNKTAYGTSDIIYSPEIFVFRFSGGEYEFRLPEEHLFVDVITCAAPCFRKALPENDNSGARERLYEVHYARGKRILECAVDNGVDYLVLGAFGCGAFHNDPAIVAKAYRDLMVKYAHHFKEVEFAVFCKDKEARNYKIFKETLQ